MKPRLTLKPGSSASSAIPVQQVVVDPSADQAEHVAEDVVVGVDPRRAARA